MNIREELIKIAGLLTDSTGNVYDPAKEIQKIIEMRKKASMVTGTVEEDARIKMAMEITDILVEKGIIPKSDYREKLNAFMEMENNKLAAVKDLVETGIYGVMPLEEPMSDIEFDDNSGFGEVHPKYQQWFDEHG